MTAAESVPFPEGTIGHLMEPISAIFSPEKSIAETVEALRSIIAREFVTYCYVVDPAQRLVGVVTMRELLFADRNKSLAEVMIKDAFALSANTTVLDGMREVISRHYPIYPVVDDQQRLLGAVRGHRLFEAQAIEISAQAGRMVGVENEERLATPWTRSFKLRHPWLQLNLLTAFVAGAVVSLFQGTIDQIIILAAFLPVLAGQSGNTGCQALAVTLRGMTLGELDGKDIGRLLSKECLLGMLNGVFVGISAGLGMYFLAISQGQQNPFILSLIVLCAMTGSCMVSGLSGALVPLTLKKLGADPATASSIFLTTATDVVSMGLLLSLATLVFM